MTATELPDAEAPVAARDGEFWTAMLRAQGRRVTKRRLVVLQALDRLEHPTVDEVHGAAAERLSGLTLQAVYLMLGDLAEAGIVRRFDAPRSAVRYETRVGDNHHHLVCTGCALIVDVDCAIGAAPCLVPSGDHGFELEAADVVFRGLCASCRATGEADAAVGAAARAPALVG